MKKIGIYTCKGTYIPDGGFNLDNPRRISLFDGRFDTGYKVIKFFVWGKGIDAGQDNDVLALLSTENDGRNQFFRAESNIQIAWAANKGGTFADVNAYQDGIVDPDNMVIEDLYFYGFSGDQGTSNVNYMIVMEKYKFSTAMGALTMVRNKSQGSDAFPRQ